MRALLLLIPLLACSKNEGVEAQRAALKRAAEEVLLPSYRSFQTNARALEAAVTSSCGAEARDAWRIAQADWKRIETYRAGPIGRERIDSAVDFWPMRVLPVNAHLEENEPFSDESVAVFGADEKGLPVIEYLLFGAADVSGRRCEYAAALSRDLVRQADAIVTAWVPEGRNYAGELISAGEDSLYYPTLQRAFDELVNELIRTLATMESMKLAKPLGKRDGGVPQPNAVESRFSAESLTNMRNNADGIRGLYGIAIAPLVVGQNEDLDRQIRAGLDRIEAALAAVPEPLAVAVIDQPAPAEALFLEVKELHRLISADAAALLGVTVTFGDNDGD